MELLKEQTKKRGRRPKNEKREYELNKEQTKFFVDVTRDQSSLDLIFGLLGKSNSKTHGREIIFKDLAIYALGKLADKDIEKIQEMSLSEMEKVERTLTEFNQKNGTTLTMGEFLVKKLNIN